MDVKRLFIALSLGLFSTLAQAWYYNAIPGITTGLVISGNTVTLAAGTDIWLCSSRGSYRTLGFHIYGHTARFPELKATFIGFSDSATGLPTQEQCQNATDETTGRIRVAHYRTAESISVPLQEGDYSVCWSGWDGYGRDAPCSAGIPVVPADDCHAELINFSNDLGTINVGEPIDHRVKIASLTMYCETAQSVTLAISQQAAPGNVLTQQILDEGGNLLEGLVTFRPASPAALYMRSTGTPQQAQRIEDSVIVTLNYE